MFEVTEGDGEQPEGETALDGAYQVTMVLTGPCEVECTFWMWLQWTLQKDVSRTVFAVFMHVVAFLVLECFQGCCSRFR